MKRIAVLLVSLLITACGAQGAHTTSVRAAASTQPVPATTSTTLPATTQPPLSTTTTGVAGPVLIDRLKLPEPPGEVRLGQDFGPIESLFTLDPELGAYRLDSNHQIAVSVVNQVVSGLVLINPSRELLADNRGRVLPVKAGTTLAALRAGVSGLQSSLWTPNRRAWGRPDGQDYVVFLLLTDTQSGCDTVEIVDSIAVYALGDPFFSDRFGRDDPCANVK